MTDLPKIETTEFQVLKVRAKFEWAHVFWRDDGLVMIVSSYGAWSFWWAAMGMPAQQFLAKLNCGYMAKKMLGSVSHVPDITATVAEVRAHILERRRDRDDSFSRSRAADEWELISQLDDCDLSFEMWTTETTLEDRNHPTD